MHQVPVFFGCALNLQQFAHVFWPPSSQILTYRRFCSCRILELSWSFSSQCGNIKPVWRLCLQVVTSMPTNAFHVIKTPGFSRYWTLLLLIFGSHLRCSSDVLFICSPFSLVLNLCILLIWQTLMLSVHKTLSLHNCQRNWPTTISTYYAFNFCRLKAIKAFSLCCNDFGDPKYQSFKNKSDILDMIGQVVAKSRVQTTPAKTGFSSYFVNFPTTDFNQV